MIAYGPDVWQSLFFLQCGAENGGKRKRKDRDLDELKKEVALVRKTNCHCSNTHSPCTVIDSIAAAPKRSPNSVTPKTPGYLTRL